jgi:hypothetical protein
MATMTSGRGLEAAVVPVFRRISTRDEAIERALVLSPGLALRAPLERPGHRRFLPGAGWTDYRKTCLYNTHDVTGSASRGGTRSAIAGRFSTSARAYRKLVIAHGFDGHRQLDILYASGRRTVRAVGLEDCPSPITFSSIYGGEVRRPANSRVGTRRILTSPRGKAIVVAGPERRSKRRGPPLEIMERSGQDDFEPRPGVSSDFGQNASASALGSTASGRDSHILPANCC